MYDECLWGSHYVSETLLILGNLRKSKCNSQGSLRGMLSSGGQRPINGMMRLAEWSRVTEGTQPGLVGSGKASW